MSKLTTTGLLLLLLVTSSCSGENNSQNASSVEGKEKLFVQKISDRTDSWTKYSIIVVTYNGSTHEFIEVQMNARSLDIEHWPSCRFCCHENNENPNSHE